MTTKLSVVTVRSEAAGVAGEHRDVEMADVDAELERVGGDDAQHLALAEPLLDRPSAGRQIAAAIAAHDAAVAGLVGDAALDRGQQDLGGEPALGEDDGRDLLPEEPDGELGRFCEIRGEDPARAIAARR